MKRFVLIALMLMLLYAVPAGADGLAVFPLEEDGILIGSAALLGSETALLTTAPITRPDALTVVSGEEKIPVEVYTDSDQLLSLLVAASPVPGTPFQLGQFSPEAVQSAGFLPGGTLLQSDCRHISYMTHPDGLTLSTASHLLPGAALLGADGSLYGLIAASLSEGDGRYFALSSAEIYTRLTEEDAESAPDISFLPYTASVEGTHVHLDWSQAPDADENASYNIYWRDSANSYYTYHTTVGCTDEIACVPGRTYFFCIRKLTSENEDPAIPNFPDGLEPVVIPEGGKMERYGFLDTAAYLAFLKDTETAAETELLPAVTDYSTVFAHEGFHLYFQITSTYEVTEELYADLTCVLTAPDGSCYSMLSGFIFAPEYMPADSWHMDITELFDECSQSIDAPAGTYTLSYYLDGALASEITFDIP